MKAPLLAAGLCSSLALLGCSQTRPSAAAPGSRSTMAGSPPANTQATSNADVPAGTYGKKESYPHASSDVSVTALIAGGASSGGPPVAPSATAIEGRLQEWRLLPADIAAEIDSGRPIIRSKPAGADAPVEPLSDQALLTLVNNRLVADADTTRVTTQLKSSHGEVTMRGSAASPGLVGRAIAIALDTKGVSKVTSELRIDPRLPPALRDDPPATGTPPGK